jgi:hypothetical protein
MSQSLIDQITLDCLLNKEMMETHVMKQREKQIHKDDLQFYKNRIFNLFKELLDEDEPEDVAPDIKYAYNTFIKNAIHYFKLEDNNDLLQDEYKNIDNDYVVEDIEDIDEDDDNYDEDENDEDFNEDLEDNNDEDIEDVSRHEEADKLLMRSVKMDIPTLDKYVKRSVYKKESPFILPKLREVDITKPELKNKGIKKNITTIYENP